MGANTAIEWATHTFNCWRGCTKVSAGCAHCYAETLSGRNPKTLGVWGPNGTRVVAAESAWKEPEKWNREASWCGNPACKAAALGRAGGVCACGLVVERPRVFCASLADVFESWHGPMSLSDGAVLLRPHLDAENSPENWDVSDLETYQKDPQGWKLVTMQDVRRRLFDLIDATPNLDWLLVTKRPEHIAQMMPAPKFDHDGWNGTLAGYWWQKEQPRPNVWLITSVENQEAANHRIPELFKVPAVVRGLSLEPLLGPVDLWRPCCEGRIRDLEATGIPGRLCADVEGTFSILDGLHWVILGGESGPGARPCKVEWIRSLVRQCKTAGVPCFTKQLGANVLWNGIQGGYGDAPSDVWPMSTADFAPAGGSWHVPLRDAKGGDPQEWPEDLRVREFPTASRRAA